MLRRQTSEMSPRAPQPLGSPRLLHVQSSPVCRLGSAPSMGSISGCPLSDSSIVFDDSFSMAESRPVRRTGLSPGKEQSLRWAWLVAGLLLLGGLLGGVSIMARSQYAHIHDHIDQEYNLYVAVWQAGDLTEFYNTNWMLIIDDQHTVDLTRTSEVTKATQTVLGTKVRRNLTSHVEFSSSGVIPYLFYSAADRDKAEHPDPAKWKRVKPEMLSHQNFRVRGVHEATGYTSWITLDDYPFVRKAPEVTGLSAKQCEDQQGRFERGTCHFMEYLSEVCIRVVVDPESYSRHNYEVDTAHAGAGCHPETGLHIPQYTRLPHIKGEGSDTYYLPASAMNATRMVLRHARDPELMEKILSYELRQELSAKKEQFMLGAVLSLACLLLLVPVLRYAAPGTARASRKAYLRWRYPHVTKDEEDVFPYTCNSVMSVV